MKARLFGGPVQGLHELDYETAPEQLEYGEVVGKDVWHAVYRYVGTSATGNYDVIYYYEEPE